MAQLPPFLRRAFIRCISFSLRAFFFLLCFLLSPFYYDRGFSLHDSVRRPVFMADAPAHFSDYQPDISPYFKAAAASH